MHAHLHTDVQLQDINIITRLPFVCENAYGSAVRVSPESCLAAGVTDGPTKEDHDDAVRVQEQLDALEAHIAAVKRAARLRDFGF
jgi:hypothetical protein